MSRRLSILGALLIACAAAAAPAQVPAGAGDTRPAAKQAAKDQVSKDQGAKQQAPKEPAAKDPAAKDPASGSAAKTEKPRVSLEQHDEQTSRDLFSACDADADDRLDLFEASDSIESLGDPKNLRSFARLDTDRDGYLSWPEFDAYFRFVTDHGKALHLRPSRPVPQFDKQTEQAPAATPLQRFFRLYDGNRDGGLDPEELDRITSQLGLLPILAAMLRNLDADRSGKIEEGELAPWFGQIEQLLPPTPAEGGAVDSAMPMPWGSGDADGDGTLTLDELTAALRRIDPSLVKWARQLFTRLDKNRDGKLDAAELGLDKPPARTTAALR
ncbi:MAG: EF-hand domain-containing protein [Planctomycetes bacterium]|nr:EF-hand domain-containing protein [Planctomycetota bacterium]